MSEVVVEGLDGDVVITRDRLGIPRITAASIADLFVGQGFATAADRLGQMEWDRRRAHGRSAELLGTPANVVTDGFHRRVRLTDHARAGHAALDTDTRAVLDAYVAGVNAYAAANRPPAELATLGVTVESWAPWDPVAVFLVRHVSFATWQTKLWNARVLAALGPAAVGRFRHEGLGGEVPVIVPPGVRSAIAAVASAGVHGLAAVGPDVVAELAPLGLALSGSNAWAVHGDRTASGLPLVAGDPHRALEVPNVYYQVHLVGPDVDVAGVSFVGIPGIQHFGQSPDVAWAVTNAMADYQDLFIERLPDAATDVRDETITVRDGEPVELECATTAHGPIVAGGTEHGIGLALASTGLAASGGSLRTILPFLCARSVGDLTTALADWVEPANNFVLADGAGHIAYRTAGRVPRRHELNHLLPVPGWDPTYDWDGVVSLDELPAVDDPAGGVIVTANQRITDAPIAGALSSDYSSPHRAIRINERLGDRDRLTVEDMRAIHTDTVWRPGLALADHVTALGGPAADVLAGWDGRLDADSTPATLAAGIFGELCRLVAADLPAELHTNPFAAWEPPATTSPVVQRLSYALSGLLAGDDDELVPGVRWVDRLPAAVQAAHAEGPRPWGDVHRLTPRFALRGAGPATDAAMTITSPPLAGGRDCVLATNQVDGLTTVPLTGSTARYVWDLADRANSRWVVPHGASGDPLSPHFTDQLAAWSSGDLHLVIDDEITATTTLRSGGGRESNPPDGDRPSQPL